MHRSRVYAVLIDTPKGEAGEAAEFWAGALGAEARGVAGEEQFTVLHGGLPGLVAAVQAIDDGAARFHLDIETDDVDAETARLLALGAVQVARWLECRVLRAPGGHLVCVIPVHSAPEVFAAGARTWE
jgi:hypothetical protein